MTERLIERLDRLGAEADIHEMTPEIRRFALLVRQDMLVQWPQRQWVGLTDEEMYLNCPNWLSQEQCKVWLAQIETKLKEKNNG
jgi:hypothetical protein